MNASSSRIGAVGAEAAEMSDAANAEVAADAQEPLEGARTALLVCARRHPSSAS
jgi:hypothetical protein